MGIYVLFSERRKISGHGFLNDEGSGEGMDERLRDMGRRFAAEPGDVSMQGRLRQELYRLVAGGAREYLPPYVQAGGVWIEDLTNQCALLDAEGLPVEKGVPVFRFYGVKSRGKPLVVTVRDLLEQDLHNQVDYWLPRTRDHVYGNWQMPCAVGLMDTLDFLLGYQPSVPEQCVVRDRALAFFRGRLTYGTRLVTRRRTAYESRGADGVYDVYVGLGSLVFVPPLLRPLTPPIG